MNDQLQSVSLGESVRFHWIRDPKFKHNRMSVNLVLPLRRDTVTEYALLPFLLRKGYRGCPDFTQFNAKLSELYGASLNGDVLKHGAEQVLSLSIVGLDDRFALGGEGVTEECARLLAGVVCEPNLIQDAFPAEDVALEKQFLKNTIEAEINDKRSYALSRCRGLICGGEPAGLRKYGYEEDLERITPEAAAAAYRRALNEATVEILFVGCGDPTGAMACFRSAFAGLQRRPVPRQKPSLPTFSGTVREEVERLDLSQSKMVLGFRTGPLPSRREQAVAQLMNALFGATPFSKLFLNVREKLSLCYYCASRLDRVTGIVLVDSGIMGENKEKAQAEILRQLQLLAEGSFTEEDLANAKRAMQNSLRTVPDSLGAQEDWYLARILGGEDPYTPAEYGQQMEQVTGEELAAAAAGLTFDAIYLLTGKED